MENLKSIDIAGQSEELPNELVQLKALIDEICASANEDYRNELSDSYASQFRAGAWAWDPITKTVSDDKVDRLGEVIMGPIYTCLEYDWPTKDGYPMAPLIQLDLAIASKTGGVNLGDGLIQVWMPHKAIAGKDQLIRVISKQFVDGKKLTPVVNLPEDLDPLQCRDEEWDDDAEEFVPAPAYQIISYSPKRYSIQLRSIKDDHTLKNITSNPVLIERIKQFDKLQQNAKKEGLTSTRTSNCHLFGTFSEIQYAPDEKPLALFCFESDEFGLMWGDGGNAQLFYSLDVEGKAIFSFDWSCT